VVVVVAGTAVVVVVAAGMVVVVVLGTFVEVVAGMVVVVEVVGGGGRVVVVVVGRVVLVGGGAMHVGVVMVLESRVTAPVRAHSRPSTTAPVAAVIEAWARMVPLKSEFVPRAAEVPTAQKMLHASAPLRRITLLPDAVVSVLPIWKMYSPPPLR